MSLSWGCWPMTNGADGIELRDLLVINWMTGC